MANKMKDFLPKIEMEKMQAMLELEEMYETGQLSLEEAREQMKTKVGKIRPYHLGINPMICVGETPNVGGISEASSTPNRPLVPAPI